MENTELLRRIGFFKGLTAMEMLRFNRIIISQHVKAGDIIINQEEKGDAVYVIKSGSVEVLIQKQGDERPVHINTLEALSHFGEMALLDDSRRSATVRAITDCSLIILKRHDLERILDSDQELAVKFYRSVATTLSQRLRSADDTIYAVRSMLNSIAAPN